MNPKTMRSFKVWGALALFLAALLALGLLMAIKVTRREAFKTPFTIGVLISSEARRPVLEGFRDGFSVLGVTNFAMVIKDADGKSAQLDALLGELIKERPDYILAIGGAEADTLARAKTDIPKFFALITQPERHGITFPGVISISPDLTFERMELAKKIIPGVKTFTILSSTTTIGGIVSAEKAKEFAEKNPDYAVTILEFGSPDELKRFASAVDKKHGIIFPAPATLISQQFAEILKSAEVQGAPLAAWSGDQARRGALFTYGEEQYDIGREAALLIYEAAVKKTPYSALLTRRVKPVLVINRKVANSFGITIPVDILRQAAEIVE